MQSDRPKRKMLSKVIDLTGQTETITMMELRMQPGDVFLQVQMGKVFEVTRNGVVVGIISPPEKRALELGAEVRRLGLVR